MTLQWHEGYPNEPVLVAIGDVLVTPTRVVTPQGHRPIGSVYWNFTDMSRTTPVIPTWAIVLAVVFVWFCFLGLLFLLAKEERVDGWVQVSVQSESFYHATQIPVSSRGQIAQYADMVNYARSVAAAGPNT